jgi:hypothetical protein
MRLVGMAPRQEETGLLDADTWSTSTGCGGGLVILTCQPQES